MEESEDMLAGNGTAVMAQFCFADRHYHANLPLLDKLCWDRLLRLKPEFHPKLHEQLYIYYLRGFCDTNTPLVKVLGFSQLTVYQLTKNEGVSCPIGILSYRFSYY